MKPILECKKLKRTALLPALVLGGILAAALPVIDLLARADSIVNPSIPPLNNLMNSDWMLMAMLNSFLMVLGTCIIYHIEFADNAIQRMDTLPIRPWSIFLSKFILLAIAFVIVFLIEGISLYFCIWKWFSFESGMLRNLAQLMAYAFLLSLPVLSLMLAVSSFCKNMWITVGIGVIGLFAAMLLQYVQGMQYFPFLMPYQPPLKGIKADSTLCIAAAAETVVFLVAGIILSKVRRNAA